VREGDRQRYSKRLRATESERARESKIPRERESRVAHTHTRTRIHALAYTRTHAHAHIHKHAYTHMTPPAHTHTHSHLHTHSLTTHIGKTQTLFFFYFCPTFPPQSVSSVCMSTSLRACTHTHTHAHSLTSAHANTHTHASKFTQINTAYVSQQSTHTARQKLARHAAQSHFSCGTISRSLDVPFLLPVVDYWTPYPLFQLPLSLKCMCQTVRDF